MTEGETKFWAIIGKASAEAPAVIRLASISMARIYLYYRKGELKLATDSPGSDWQLASAEPMRVQALDQVSSWIANRSRQLPIF